MTKPMTFSLGSSGFRVGTDDWSLPTDAYYYPNVDLVENKITAMDLVPEYEGQIVYTIDTNELLVGKMTSLSGGSWYTIANDGLESVSV